MSDKIKSDRRMFFCAAATGLAGAQFAAIAPALAASPARRHSVCQGIPMLEPRIEIIATGLGWAESPVAMIDGSVIVSDGHAGALVRIGADGKRSIAANVGDAPNGNAPGPGGKLFICNSGQGRWVDGPFPNVRGAGPDNHGGYIQRVDPVAGQAEVLYTECDGVKLSAPNDLVFDNHDGFYFTDFGHIFPTHQNHGGVFYALADGSAINRVVYPFTTANGVGLSPDGQTLYVAQSGSARLWAFDIVAPGKVQSRPFPSPGGGRLVAGSSEFVVFDSLKVQANGYIAVASQNNGCFTVFTPGGEIVHQIRMPEDHPTNICFAGTDMRTAYVTLVRTGQLGKLTWPDAGLRLNYTV